MESIPCILYPGSMDRISTQLPAMKVGIIRWQSQKAADKRIKDYNIATLLGKPGLTMS